MHKKVLAMLLVVLSITSLAGCSKSDNENPYMKYSKKELAEYVLSQESRIESKNDEIERLEGMLKGIQGETIEVPAISEFSDGSGRLTLNSIDGKVTLPVPFEYPQTIPTYASSGLYISEYFKIVPSASWVARLSGTTTDVEHSGLGISGQFVIGQIEPTPGEDQVRIEQLKDYINTFFDSMPPENVKFTRIYLDDLWVGMDASAHTFLNEKDAQIRCGMIGYGEMGIVYMFIYEGKQDVTKDETITSLMKTATISGRSLRIE